MKRRAVCNSCVLISFAILSYGSVLLGESLRVRVDGDRLRATGAAIHFLTGGPLERLHNGRTVTYVVELMVRSERAGHVLARIAERFTFSYDLWEEKFSVTRLASPTRSASNLSGNAAEAWCLDNVSIPVSEIPMDRPFWVGLEYASEEPKDSSKSDTATLTLGSLIDIFSRRPRDDQQVRATEEAGPFRLQDLMKKVK